MNRIVLHIIVIIALFAVTAITPIGAAVSAPMILWLLTIGVNQMFTILASYLTTAIVAYLIIFAYPMWRRRKVA